MQSRRGTSPTVKEDPTSVNRNMNIGESRQGDESELGASPPGQTREGPRWPWRGLDPQYDGRWTAKKQTSQGLSLGIHHANGVVLILTGQGPEPSGPTSIDARGWPSGAAFKHPQSRTAGDRGRQAVQIRCERPGEEEDRSSRSAWWHPEESRGASEFSREASRPA